MISLAVFFKGYWFRVNGRSSCTVKTWLNTILFYSSESRCYCVLLSSSCTRPFSLSKLVSHAQSQIQKKAFFDVFPHFVLFSRLSIKHKKRCLPRRVWKVLKLLRKWLTLKFSRVSSNFFSLLVWSTRVKGKRWVSHEIKEILLVFEVPYVIELVTGESAR